MTENYETQKINQQDEVDLLIDDSAETMEKFIELSTLVNESSVSYIKLYYILQFHQDCWMLTRKWPYCRINLDRVLDLMNSEIRYFAAFPRTALFQNISISDFGKRIGGMLIGGGTDGGIGSEGEHFVQGVPNPQSHFFFDPPNLFSSWSQIFFPGQFSLICSGDGILSQYIVNKVDDGSGKIRHPFNFDYRAINYLQEVYLDEFYRNRIELDDERFSMHEELLGDVFCENRRIIEEGIAHYLSNRDDNPRHNTPSPNPLKFGRIVYDSNEEKLKIKNNFSLLHYEKAILEYNHLLNSSDHDKSAIHGAYCIIALGAMIEALSNRIYFHSNHTSRPRDEKRTPIDRIQDEAATIIARSSIRKARGLPLQFKKIFETSPEYLAIEEVREIRNSLMHFNEELFYIDENTGLSLQNTSFSIENCRRLMRLTREGLVSIMKQLPEVESPIVIQPNVSWMGSLEVP